MKLLYLRLWMNAQYRKFTKNEEGMGTIEIVIIIAVLIGLAFLFRTFVTDFFNELTKGIKDNNKIDDLFK